MEEVRTLLENSVIPDWLFTKDEKDINDCVAFLLRGFPNPIGVPDIEVGDVWIEAKKDLVEPSILEALKEELSRHRKDVTSVALIYGEAKSTLLKSLGVPYIIVRRETSRKQWCAKLRDSLIGEGYKEFTDGQGKPRSVLSASWFLPKIPLKYFLGTSNEYLAEGPPGLTLGLTLNRSTFKVEVVKWRIENLSIDEHIRSLLRSLKLPPWIEPKEGRVCFTLRSVIKVTQGLDSVPLAVEHYKQFKKTLGPLLLEALKKDNCRWQS